MTDPGADAAAPDAPAPDAAAEDGSEPSPSTAQLAAIVTHPETPPLEVHHPIAERARLTVWALAVALVGLALSFFVGWGFPIGLTAIVLAIVALRRPWERRGTAVWAIVLAALSIVYSAGWLVYAAIVTSSGR